MTIYSVVLDEATSVVDEETERKLYEKCCGLGMCLVSISHRMSLVKVSMTVVVILQQLYVFYSRSIMTWNCI